MSLFQCDKCGCCENTALSAHGHSYESIYDWSGIEEFKGKQTCCVCGPKQYSDGKPTGNGNWHDQFDRVFLPKGEFETNREGNLQHKVTGTTDFHKYAIKEEQNG